MMNVEILLPRSLSYFIYLYILLLMSIFDEINSPDLTVTFENMGGGG